ncbi:DNA-binding protein [Rugamonas sp.]|uniref:DNA-binding protein n=1 Tax=Rugamonas sp. TaxID=1926287 RepID=UPI0025D370D6|nr:DNA-binding protein [Rugamonas sp.]
MPVPQTFPPLETVTSPTVGNAAAAYYLNRSKQTMRLWACNGGPISPLRINRRLAWPTAEIRRLTGMGV